MVRWEAGSRCGRSEQDLIYKGRLKARHTRVSASYFLKQRRSTRPRAPVLIIIIIIIIKIIIKLIIINLFHYFTGKRLLISLLITVGNQKVNLK